MQHLNGKNSPFHPQADSIDWGVMSLCRHSRISALELPTLAQEETTGSPAKKQKTGKKKKKPDDNDESPEHSTRHDPASSNPANLPVQYESEEELIPRVPTSSGTGSSERTMRYTDQEDGDSEDSQRTRSCDDHQADLVLHKAHWSLMTAEQKICANTGSFTVPRDIKGNPVFLGRVKGTFTPSPQCGFSHQKHTDQNHVDQLCKNMTDDDRAVFVLYSSKQESLKASSTSTLIGKKRKEATATVQECEVQKRKHRGEEMFFLVPEA